MAGTPSGTPALGTTDRARGLVKLGNLLVVASEDGDLVTIDTSDPTGGRAASSSTRYFNRGTSYPRALATDGHNRVFYSGLLGPFWVTRVLRREDAREASAECLRFARLGRRPARASTGSTATSGWPTRAATTAA